MRRGTCPSGSRRKSTSPAESCCPGKWVPRAHTGGERRTESPAGVPRGRKSASALLLASPGASVPEEQLGVSCPL